MRMSNTIGKLVKKNKRIITILLIVVIICGLVYRLMVTMTDEEIRESLETADDIMDGSSSNDEDKEEKNQIIKDYNKYLIFIEKYFSDKNAKPLKT